MDKNSIKSNPTKITEKSAPKRPFLTLNPNKLP